MDSEPLIEMQTLLLRQKYIMNFITKTKTKTKTLSKINIDSEIHLNS